MRRVLKGLAVLAVVLAGAVTAVVIHRLQGEKDIRGSSTEFVTTLQKAVRLVSFRPVLPAANPLAIAIIPPLGNEDTIATRGIAFEYDANGAPMLLSEWPAQSFRIAFGKRDATDPPCALVRYMHNGVVWTTPHGIAMTLQPDGDATYATVEREARALLARGACR